MYIDLNLAQNELEKHNLEGDNRTVMSGEYPSGEFEYLEFDGWKKFVVKLRMLIALPWGRVRKGNVLTMKLRGQISDQLKSRFASGISLPQICENFIKAAYDPRISGICLHIEPLECGWGKVEEIRRHMLDYKKSGKFLVGYVPVCGEKEYYLACACEELYDATNIAGDAISLVFGKETRGRVCGMGFGVTPSKVGAFVQQNGTVKQLQSMVLV